jgi:serine protease AprX
MGLAVSAGGSLELRAAVTGPGSSDGSSNGNGDHARTSWVVNNFINGLSNSDTSGKPKKALQNTTLNVIVPGPQSLMDRLEHQYHLRVVAKLESGSVFEGTADSLSQLAADSQVPTVVEDGRVQGTMAISSQSTGANLVWGGSSGSGGGVTGNGVTVAVIDSGRASHPDLNDAFVFDKDFTGKGPKDQYGHGTHIAGIITGSGIASGTTPANKGIAPDAKLVNLRVLDENGAGNASDVIAAIEWSIRNRYRFNIRVLNLSLGMYPTTSYKDDPMAQAVERAVAQGLVVVCAAGNFGKLPDGTPLVGTIVSPGFTPGALTVGAMNTHGTVGRNDDTMASYSSRGPVGSSTDKSTWIIKPDLVAPGNAIVST